jgi:hypothetical protein
MKEPHTPLKVKTANGNRNAERIRCSILGFQVVERLAAWNSNRFEGGL